MKRVLSYGGGVQSSTIALMAARGEVECDAVIFCDTGSELQSTYDTVEFVSKEVQKSGIAFYTAYAHFNQSENNHVNGYMPLHEWYTLHNRIPMVRNPRCTFNWKILPFRRLIRELYPSKTKPLAQVMLGITTDEAHRARESNVQYLENVFPLLDMDMSRQACIDWLKKNYPNQKFAKSGCFMCMYQGAKNWNALKANEPELFALAIQMERNARADGIKVGLWGGRSIEAFNHDRTLKDFGFDFGPDDFDCEASGSCFL